MLRKSINQFIFALLFRFAIWNMKMYKTITAFKVCTCSFHSFIHSKKKTQKKPLTNSLKQIYWFKLLEIYLKFWSVLIMELRKFLKISSLMDDDKSNITGRCRILKAAGWVYSVKQISATFKLYTVWEASGLNLFP